MRALSDLEVLALPARLWAGEVKLANISTDDASGNLVEASFTLSYVNNWITGMRLHGMSDIKAGVALLQWAQDPPVATIYVED